MVVGKSKATPKEKNVKTTKIVKSSVSQTPLAWKIKRRQLRKKRD